MTLRRLAIAAFCAVALMYAGMNHAAPSKLRRLVLVTAVEADIPVLTPAELRRAYLGAPIIKNGHHIKPLRNVTDPLLYQVFLQKIIFMSAGSYERQLLKRVFRRGGKRPPEYSDPSRLVNALQQDPDTVTYMWAAVTEATPGIKVVQELWLGQVD